MATILRRSPAKRRGQSTQVTTRDLALLEKDINDLTSGRPAQLRRRKSDTSIVPTVFQIWTPAQALPNVESSHILDELVSSEAAYLAELRSIYSTIVRPHRIASLASSPYMASPDKARRAAASPKKHSRTGSLFSIRSDKEASHAQQQSDLRDSDHLERAFRSIESMVKSHSALFSAFVDSKSPHQLVAAFVVRVEGLLLKYRSFVVTLPYISSLLPSADDALPNKLSGYSRFLGPMQRAIKYELLIRRLAGALYKESGSLELQNLVKVALRASERFCQALEEAQKAEQAKIHLTTLTTRLGIDVTHKTLAFEGSVTTEALSSKKGCKINFALLFTDGSIFWNSSSTEQDRSPKSWLHEKVARTEDGGCLDLIVHTTLEKADKVKAVRRAVGFPTIQRPLSTFDHPTRSPDRKHDSAQPAVELILEKGGVSGEKRRRKETVVEDWLSVGAVQEKQQKRFSLASANISDPIPTVITSPTSLVESRTGYF